MRPFAAILAGTMALLVLAGPAAAQSLSLDIGPEASLTRTGVQLIALVTVLSIVPGLAVTITCFPFVVTVLSILRQALGLQQSPPNMLIVSLALFLSYFVMEPVIVAAWHDGIEPYVDGQLDLEEALGPTLAPFREFMAARTEGETYAELARLRPEAALELSPQSDLGVLIPAFLLSEIGRAFQIGFLLFLPFLVIDLVVAAVLMSMGMMMVPPAMVALPFKLAFFVVVDGWTLVASALVRGYM